MNNIEYKTPYKLSKDYKRLKRLLDFGYRICCYANYIWDDKNITRDICHAIKIDYKRDDYKYSIGCRGICYLEWSTDFPYDISFEDQCKKKNIEFIDVDNI